MKSKKRWTAIFLVAAVMLLQSAAMAANLDYSGPIDSFTGQPVSESGTNQDSVKVPITTGVYYDRVEHAYVYDLTGTSDGSILSNVMDGMIVNDAVKIEVSGGTELRLHREGTVVEEVDLDEIKEPGRYVLEAQAAGGQYVRVMGFTIVGSATGLISSYPMPSGFVIKSVEMSVKDENGLWKEAQPKWDRSKVSMTEDGSYRVQYECARNGLNYTLQTEIDHTPPTLALENVVNGLAKGPVDISDLEEGCRISITLNGGSMSYREELTLSGDYEIVLLDEAGNHTNYTFSILTYFDINSWIFFALVVMVVAGIGIYLYMERKRMRVR